MKKFFFVRLEYLLSCFLKEIIISVNMKFNILIFRGKIK